MNPYNALAAHLLARMFGITGTSAGRTSALGTIAQTPFIEVTMEAGDSQGFTAGSGIRQYTQAFTVVLYDAYTGVPESVVPQQRDWLWQFIQSIEADPFLETASLDFEVEQCQHIRTLPEDIVKRNSRDFHIAGVTVEVIFDA